MYLHTQTSSLCLLVYATAIALFVGAWFAQDQAIIALILLGSGSLSVLLATAFHHLTVADEGDRLVVRFGPLPLFQIKILYTDIQKVEIGRTMILDGWGIHLRLRGGWVWNLWGRDCVVIHRQKGIIRIGTDDAENLARFLEGKIGQAGTSLRHESNSHMSEFSLEILLKVTSGPFGKLGRLDMIYWLTANTYPIPFLGKGTKGTIICRDRDSPNSVLAPRELDVPLADAEMIVGLFRTLDFPGRSLDVEPVADTSDSWTTFSLQIYLDDKLDILSLGLQCSGLAGKDAKSIQNIFARLFEVGKVADRGLWQVLAGQTFASAEMGKARP